MEFALHPEIPNFAGGLGVLAADLMKSAADLELPVVGLSLIYHQDDDPKKAFDPGKFMEKQPEIISIDIEGREVEIGVWKYEVEGKSGFKVPIYFLDSFISENKRWDRDCIDLKPDVLSILVGVNDIWHKLNGKYDGTAEVYRDGFAALLKRTKKALPDTTIVVCEPFALKCGAVLKGEWFPDFDTRRAYAKEVADAAGTLWVPFQKMFDDAIAEGTK